MLTFIFIEHNTQTINTAIFYTKAFFPLQIDIANYKAKAYRWVSSIAARIGTSDASFGTVLCYSLASPKAQTVDRQHNGGPECTADRRSHCLAARKEPHKKKRRTSRQIIDFETHKIEFSLLFDSACSSALSHYSAVHTFEWRSARERFSL